MFCLRAVRAPRPAILFASACPTATATTAIQTQIRTAHRARPRASASTAQRPRALFHACCRQAAMADPTKTATGEKGAKGAARKPPSIPAPSASVVVISPQNEILLLHRVNTGTFSSAHVFPGGNLSRFHEGALIPAVGSPERHVDGPAYRLAAIRETFEESGVLLARPAGQPSTGTGTDADAVTANRSLLRITEAQSRDGRARVAAGKVRFEDWLASVGGVADSENLIPFTRWVTPPNMPRRFTTQMYLYLLPLEDGGAVSTAGRTEGPDSSGGASADLTEVMAAEFASAATWVQRAQQNAIILFPPQMYILSLLAPRLAGPAGLPAGASGGTAAAVQHYAAERARVAALVRDGRAADEDAATFVPWAERVISPRMLARLPAAVDARGRGVMALDQPGPELKRTGRAGDAYRVVLVGNLPPGPPRDLELRRRADVEPLLAAAKAEAKKAQEAKL